MTAAVFVSSTEGREIPGCSVWTDLEELTGADCMISPVNLPFAPAFLELHIAGGAMLVQIKRGHDLAASVLDGRLKRSLARMRSIKGIRQAQCCLLFIGYVTEAANGDAEINGQSARVIDYWGIQTALAHWNAGGGVIEQLPRSALLPTWIDKTLSRLESYVKNPKQEVLNISRLYLAEETMGSLRELVEIKDWRKTLSTFPNIGPKRLTTILDAMQAAGAEITLLNALSWLTTYDYVKNLPGIGKSSVDTWREWIGLQPGENLAIQLEENGRQ